MKIAYLSEGCTIHDQRFLDLFEYAGHETVHLSLFGSPCISGSPEPAKNRRILQCGATSTPSPRDVIPLLPWLRHALDSFGPQVLVAGPMHTAAFAAVNLDAGPVVAVSWGSDLLLHAAQDLECRGAAAWTLCRAERVLADAHVVAEAAMEVGGIARERISVAPWGVELDRHDEYAQQNRGKALRDGLGLGEDDLLVFTNRSWFPLYRPKIVLNAFFEALTEQPRLYLYMAGQGEMAAEIKALAKELDILDRVCFPGWLSQEEMAAGYSAADLYLSCSSSDGSSISLLQAMASSTPCVVSDIAGNREWVEQGVSGLFAPVDDVGATSAAIQRLAEMPAKERKRMGEKALSVARLRADWTRNGRTILQAVEQAVQGKEAAT